ncbi:lysine-specific permease [Piptocephalis cylindrospora]|uniref:Lysine-specific permease n=1 Tax=Piptocephalis cylindrospora TaxID=1907219 RepID=A0A4V1IY92_9FUNG|nr:lysine-specific permease [Piptocephalis cylindrospora]|eukprot:RKP13749.1 lysine-specific permease [Piptocephalis cylindrospora]
MPDDKAESIQSGGRGRGGRELKRGLKTRHLTMISLGGTIGTGLFLASGGSVAEAGPGGALLAYGLIGILVYFMIQSLGEMATYLPVTGSFSTYGARFVDPAFGFALGWNYWYSWATTLAVELSAAELVMGYWFPNVNGIVWSAVVLVIVLALNMISVKGYGEAEYWFSLTKVLTVVVFIVIGILVAAGAVGGHTYGVENWKGGQAFLGGFGGTFSVLLAAGFSFQGTEIVGVTAGESSNPRKAVPKAIRQVFWRILLFYVCALFLIGLIISPDDPALLNGDSNIGSSPFTLVFKAAKLSGADHVMNAVILITVLSAGNSSMYAASRTLYTLAREGKAPRIFGTTNRHGVPVWSILVTAVIGALAFLSSLLGTGKVYNWLLSLAGISGFIAWLGISMSHYRFRKAFIYQGHDLSELPYRAMLYPFGPIFATVAAALVILGQGYSSFTATPIAVDQVISAYIGIPLFLILWFGYKIICKTKVVPLAQVDLDTGRPTQQEKDMDVGDDEGMGVSSSKMVRMVRMIRRSPPGKVLEWIF